MKDWTKDARCRGVNDPSGALFPTDDEHEPVDWVKVMCALCPVNAQCLNFALDNETRGGEAGIWGGTTPLQRRLMKVPKERQSCPGCGADAVVAKGRGEICISCGLSWLI
jgi:transcription factor WhiB